MTRAPPERRIKAQTTTERRIEALEKRVADLERIAKRLDEYWIEGKPRRKGEG